MSHSLDGAVVQVDVRHFHIFRKRIGIHGEPVILRRDRDFSAPQIFDRLVPTPVSELELERPATHGKSKELMSETNPEDRFLAEQTAERLVRILDRLRISGSVRKKNTVGI